MKKYFSFILLELSAGVVIAGFNKNNFHPSSISFNLITEYEDEIIIKDNDSYINYKGSSIIPFAQNDVANTFISGINDEIEELLEYYIATYNCAYLNNLMELLIEKECIDIDCAYKELENIEKITKYNAESFNNIIEDFKDENQNYVSNGLRELSTEALIAMVVNMIEFTSLKRKIDSDLDSVGGDIDILIITKGDGLTYKRKIDFTKE